MNHLTLEEKVAQLFMVGYEGATPNAITRRFLDVGVGGLIFFRDNFDGLRPLSPGLVREHLEKLTVMLPAHLPRPLLGIDQEGGQVERLPHTVFPTGLTPRAIALSSEPEALARDQYALMANRLRQLGFTLDFFPTLDVNLNPENPIIGVRSFGDEPETVWRLGKIALEAFENVGLIAVGKHFPGHGNGTVDSHLDLPTLHFTDAELQPFRQAIEHGLPAILVAHGYYPALQTTDEERALPSSASPAVIQGLLRQRCGFDGVVITDDLCMGAITKHRSPVEAALACLRAGVDILLYKQSTDDEWAVYEAVLAAFWNGLLPMAQLEASLQRIDRLKAWLVAQAQPMFSPEDFAPERIEAEAMAIARRGVSVLSGNPALLPLKPESRLLVIHPPRETMGNYAFDAPTSDNLGKLLRKAGFRNLRINCYPPRSPFDPVTILEEACGEMRDAELPEAILLVTFNPLSQPDQVALYRLLHARFPGAPIILVSAGTAYDATVMPDAALHIALCSYRPASMRALSEFLKK